MSELPQQHAPKIAVVLGAGGIAGYSFHAGSLAAIEQATGWDARTAEILIGTSAGSSVGAVIRGNVSVSTLVDRILSVPTDYKGMDRLRRVAGRGESLFSARLPLPASPGLVWKELMGLRRPNIGRLVAGSLPIGVLNTEVLAEQADVLHPTSWPEKRLWIPAVDLDTGEVTVFGRDHQGVGVGTAVAASCAIPAYFKPVEIDGRRFVDGGVRSLVNANLLAESGVDLVVVTSPLSLSRWSVGSPLTSAIRSLPTHQLRREIAVLQDAGILTLVLEPDPTTSRVMGANAMDPTRMVPVLTASAMAATEQLEESVDTEILDLLRQAGKRLIPPVDVPYPD